MRILLIGSGGREHALAWKFSRDRNVDKIFIAPGNGGTSDFGENVPIGPGEIDKLVEFAKQNAIDLVVPGPELPLTLGICDAMKQAGIRCFGPDKYCAQLEGSKSFAKDLMARAGVPTAASKVFTDPQKAREYIEKGPQKVVIKADGLAAGKGVVVANSHAEALSAVDAMLAKGEFGRAGEKIVVEEWLDGEEVSLMAFCDGITAIPLASCQDHKAAYDGDTGPNTGGMGAYCPAPILPDSQLGAMTDLVIRPILREFAKEGHPYTGIMYAGLMIAKDGPKVLEYNVRFGDPECQPLMARMESSLSDIVLACCNGDLKGAKVDFRPESALGVVLAEEGYPGQYQKGHKIEGMEQAASHAIVFQAGTVRNEDAICSAGGRVLCVTALGKDLPEARDRAYEAMEKVKMPHGRYRRDIGSKGLAWLEKHKDA